MQFKTHITKKITSLDGKRFSIGYKNLLLPFAPFIGLRLTEKLGHSEPISSISWDEKNATFYCHIDSCEYEDQDGEFVNFDFLMRIAVRDGWEGFDCIYTK